jgi:hypothetical protein
MPIDSAGVSGKRKKILYKMAATLKEKRTSITMAREQNATFPIPLISHYPLPLTLLVSAAYT